MCWLLGETTCVYRCVYIGMHASRVISFVFNLLVTREIIMCICITIWDRIWFLYLNFSMCVYVVYVIEYLWVLRVCPYSLHCQLLVWLWLSFASFSLCRVVHVYRTTSFFCLCACKAISPPSSVNACMQLISSICQNLNPGDSHEFVPYPPLPPLGLPSQHSTPRSSCNLLSPNLCGTLLASHAAPCGPLIISFNISLATSII